MYMNEGIEWLAPMTRDQLLSIIRETVHGQNGVHLRSLLPRLVEEGVKPVSIRELGRLIQVLGIPVREQLKVAGSNAPGIHWAAVLDCSTPRRNAGFGTERCIARIDGRKCGMPSAIEAPVTLCAYHRWEVAVGVAPELRDCMPAPSHPSQLPEQACPVPTPGKGVHSAVVYFLAMGNRVKIGLTTNLEKRMSTLAVSRDSVNLTLDGGRDLEAALHQHFTSLRVNGTEWFRLEPPLSDYIAAKAAQPLP